MVKEVHWRQEEIQTSEISVYHDLLRLLSLVGRANCEQIHQEEPDPVLYSQDLPF